MPINARDYIANLPESRQEKIHATADRIIAREYSSPGESVGFKFTLILDRVPDLTPEVADAIYEAGCHDGLLSQRDGVVSIEFERAAPTRMDAIVSAILDIESANVGARCRVQARHRPALVTRKITWRTLSIRCRRSSSKSPSSPN